jgi:basic membrane protein A
MKKNLLVVIVLVIILGLCLSSTLFAAAEQIKVGIVTDVGGRGDRSFNDSAICGLETWASKVKYVLGGGYEPLSDEEFKASIPEDLANAGIYSMNVIPIVLESKDKKDYIPNISTLVEQVRCDLVIGVGFMLAGAIGESAIKYPDTKFMLIDALPVDETGTVVDLANVVSYLFNEHECGFLVGAIAGYATKAAKVGYIGGMPIPPVHRYEAGYWAGLKTTNPNAATYGQYTGSFTEPALGKSSAESQISLGCDILFQVAGATGNGMFQAICEKGDPYWAIGVDVDQGLDINLCPDRTLTSAIKHVDYATYLAIKNVVDNTFQSGLIVMALKDGGVGWAPGHIKDVLTQEEINKVEHLSQMIIDGEITVPQDPKNVKEWTPPTDF